MEYNSDFNVLVIVFVYLLSVYIPLFVFRMCDSVLLPAFYNDITILNDMSPDEAADYVGSYVPGQRVYVPLYDRFVGSFVGASYCVGSLIAAVVSFYLCVDWESWVICVGTTCANTFHLLYAFTFLSTICIFAIWSSLSVLDPLWWLTVPWSSPFIPSVFLGVTNPNIKYKGRLNGRELHALRDFRRDLKSEYVSALWQDTDFKFFAPDDDVMAFGNLRGPSVVILDSFPECVTEKNKNHKKKVSFADYEDQARAFSSPWVDNLRKGLSAVSSLPGVDTSTAKFVEKVGLWLISLSLQTSSTGCAAVTGLFVTSMYSKSTILILLEQVEKVFGGEYTNQAGSDDFTDLRVLLEFWKESRKSDIAKRFQQLLSLMVCYGFTDKLGVDFDKNAHLEYYKASGLSDLWAPDLVAQCLETCLLVWDTAHQYWATNDIRSVFSSNFAAVECDKEHAKLIASVPNYLDGTLDKLNPPILEAEFNLRLEELKIKTTGYLSRAKGPERHVLARRLLDVEKAIASIAAFHRDNTMRCKPFAIKFYGRTGQGKTTALDAVCKAALEHMGLPGDKRLITSVNSDDKYQSDVSTRHVIVKFDDMANTKSEKQQNNPVSLLIDDLNNDMKTVLKADLNEKGKVFWNNKLALITTNVEDLDAGFYSNEPSSILRRIEMHVNQKLKPAFATTGRGLKMINPESFKGRVLVDAWDFDIKLYTPSSDRNSQGDFNDYYEHEFESGEKLVCKDISLHQLLLVFREKFLSHLMRQEAFVKASSSIYDMTLCPHGSYAPICTACQAVIPYSDQADEIELARPSWFQRKIKNRPFFKKISNFAFFRPMLLTSLCAIGAAGATFAPLYAMGWLFSYSTYVSVPVSVFSSFVSFYTTCTCVKSTVVDYISSFSLSDARKKMADAWWRNKTLRYASYMAAAYCAVRAIMFMWSSFCSPDVKKDYVPNGQVFSPPVPDHVPVNDFWAPKQPQHQRQEAPHDLRTMTKDQVHAVIGSQLGHATFSNGVKIAVCDVLLVCSNYVIMPYHVLAMTGGHPSDVTIIFHDKTVVGSRMSAKVSPLTIVRIGKTDLALMYVGAGGSRKNLLKFFPTAPIRDQHHVVSELYRDETGLLKHDKYATRHFDWRQPEMDECFDALFYDRSSPTFNGLCCAVLVSERSVPQIMGLHVKGKDGQPSGVSCMVTQSMLQVALDHLAGVSIVPAMVDNEDNRVYIPEGYKVQFSEFVHDKSPCNWLPSDSYIVSFGAHDGVRRLAKTHVEATTMSETIAKECGIVRKHGPSPFLGTRKIWYDNLLPMTQPKQLPHDLLNLAYMDRRDEVLGLLKANPHLLSVVKPLDIVTACSGANGIRGIDRMPQSTSMGWPICKPKSKFFVPLDPLPHCSAPLTLPDEMLEELEKLRAILARKNRINAVFYGCPKDEPTKFDKEKVRIFAACPWYLSILVRQYYLPIARLYLAFPALFESAVGVNAHGPEWHKLIRHMAANGEDRMIFGDYEAFDKKVSYLVAILPWKLWISIAELAGYDQESLNIMASLAEEICRPNYEFNGEVLSTDGTTPSGHNMTVFSNCEINCLYLRSSFYFTAREFSIKRGAPRKRVVDESLADSSYKLTGVPLCSVEFQQFLDAQPLLSNLDGRFASYVNALTYGDDNGMSVSSDAPWFNHMTVASFLGSCGIRYTTAQKTEPTVPYCDISQLSFLKRAARFDADLDITLAPLEMDSIYKSLHCRQQNKDVSADEYNAAAIESALLELFFHGEDVYVHHRNNLQRVVDTMEMGPWLSASILPSYAQQREDWLGRYRPKPSPAVSVAQTPEGGV